MSNQLGLCSLRAQKYLGARNMNLTFTCPECNSDARLTLGEKQEADVKEKILSAGRSPTLITECSKGHELLVTLYFRGDELAVRDITVPFIPEMDKTETREQDSEIDWVKQAFGGKD